MTNVEKLLKMYKEFYHFSSFIRLWGTEDFHSVKIYGPLKAQFVAFLYESLYRLCFIKKQLNNPSFISRFRYKYGGLCAALHIPNLSETFLLASEAFAKIEKERWGEKTNQFPVEAIAEAAKSSRPFNDDNIGNIWFRSVDKFNPDHPHYAIRVKLLDDLIKLFAAAVDHVTQRLPENQSLYQFRNFPCNIVKDEDLWIISGCHSYWFYCNEYGLTRRIQSGVLEWCVSKEDAEWRMKLMQIAANEGESFWDLSVRSFKEERALCTQ